MDLGTYCRTIESHLCRRNEGHLIRIVGPAFELVSGWARQGIPLKVACHGIDRCVDRGSRKGSRRRPVRIEFCDDDVLEAFEEWRRLVGVIGGVGSDAAGADDEGSKGVAASRQPSLRDHLRRVFDRLVAARARVDLPPGLGPVLDELLDEISRPMNQSGALRGAARQAVVSDLARLDGVLMAAARAHVDRSDLGELQREAEADLADYRDRLTPASFAQARTAVEGRLVRERLGLPTITWP